MADTFNEPRFDEQGRQGLQSMGASHDSLQSHFDWLEWHVQGRQR